jgi:hypothetical protein
MDLVKKEYAEKGLRDTDFATYVSETLKRSYSVAQIRSYRLALGIPATVKAEEVLEEDLAKAKDLLIACLQNLHAGFNPDLEVQIREFLK